MTSSKTLRNRKKNNKNNSNSNIFVLNLYFGRFSTILASLNQNVIFVQNSSVFLVRDVQVVAHIVNVGFGHSGNVILSDDVAFRIFKQKKCLRHISL